MSPASVLAACGKGGVGKSVFIAACVRILSAQKTRILAIDADPAGGLRHLLGMDRDMTTIGGVRDRLIEAAKEKMTTEEIARSFDYMLMESLVETPAFDFLAMGHSRFKGCFCPVNRLLKDAVEALAGNYDVVLIDAEAGLEQVYRDVMGRVDYLALVTDSSLRSIRAAEELMSVAQSLGMNCRAGAVVNRFDGRSPSPGAKLGESGICVLGVIPEDEELRKNDAEGKTIFELSAHSPLIGSVENIVQGLWSRKGDRLIWANKKS